MPGSKNRLYLFAPVLEQRDWRDHQRWRRLRRLLARPGDERQQLQRLAEPHVVGEHGATAVLGRLSEQVLQPRESLELMLLELNPATQADRKLRVGDPAQELGSLLEVVDRGNVRLDQ